MRRHSSACTLNRSSQVFASFMGQPLLRCVGRSLPVLEPRFETHRRAVGAVILRVLGVRGPPSLPHGPALFQPSIDFKKLAMSHARAPALNASSTSGSPSGAIAARSHCQNGCISPQSLNGSHPATEPIAACGRAKEPPKVRLRRDREVRIQLFIAPPYLEPPPTGFVFLERWQVRSNRSFFPASASRAASTRLCPVGMRLALHSCEHFLGGHHHQLKGAMPISV